MLLLNHSTSKAHIILTYNQNNFILQTSVLKIIFQPSKKRQDTILRVMKTVDEPTKLEYIQILIALYLEKSFYLHEAEGPDLKERMAEIESEA